MNELIDVNSLIRVSKVAKIIDKSAAWVHKLAEANELDMVSVDGVHFIRVNQKFQKYIKK